MTTLLRQAGFAHSALWPRAPRPGAQFGAHYAGPSRSHMLRALLRRPLAAAHTVQTFKALQRAAVRWPQWAALPIVCIVARKTQPLPAAGLIAL